MKESTFPSGWDEDRVKRVLCHYESQSEENAAAEDEAAWEDSAQTFMEIPNDLIPTVRGMLAKRARKSSRGGKLLVEIASEIVQTQLSLKSISAVDIVTSLRQVFGTLHELQKAEAEEIELVPSDKEKPVLSPANSIKYDKIICLECGAEMKQLTSKHLVSHGMIPKEYRKKYGFPIRAPLSARSLTHARSKAAKKRGLPENLQKYIEALRQKKAAAFTQGATKTSEANKPKRTRLRKNKVV